MTEQIKRAYALLDASTRKKLPFLLISFSLIALFDAVSIGMVFPFILAIIDPGATEKFVLMQSLSNFVGAKNQKELIVALALTTGILFILKNLLSAFLVRWQFSVLFKCEANVSVGLLDRYLSNAWQVVSTRNSSELIRNASTSTSHVFLSFIIPSISLFVECLIAIILIIALTIVEFEIAISLLVILSTMATVYFLLVRKRLFQVGKDFQDANFNVLNNLKQGIASGKEIRVLDVQSEFLNDLSQARKLYAHAQTQRSFINVLPRYYLESVLVISILAVVYLVSNNRPLVEIVPILALFGISALRLVASAIRILTALQQIRIGLAPLDDVFKDYSLNSYTNNSQFVSLPKSVFEQGKEICLKKINFSYASSKKTLKNINLTIPIGSSLGIVGASGSGKSTFIDLFLGLLEKDSGSFTIDGHSIEESLKSWQSNLGYVPQEIYLVDDTIANNIAFGIPRYEINLQAVENAAMLAQLQEVLGSLPQGFDTHVGELGSFLSGGQKQRVGIARALYRNPNILILDEATSALDNESENKFLNAIQPIMKHKTTLIVSHKINTVRNCEQIAVFNNGEIVEIGTYNELMKNGAHFNKLAKIGKT